MKNPMRFLSTLKNALVYAFEFPILTIATLMTMANHRLAFANAAKFQASHYNVISHDLSNICLAVTNSNMLTIYGTNMHFFTELVCRNCDNGEFYYDTHSIYGPIIGTLRDDYEYRIKQGMRFFSMTLTDDQARNALFEIKNLAEMISYRVINYSLDSFSCIEYAQQVYVAAGGNDHFISQFPEDYLSGKAGALAYLKYNMYSTSSIFNALKILYLAPKEQESVKDYKNEIKPCFSNRNESYFCRETPSGHLVPIDYESPFIPDCEIRGNRFVFYW